MIRSLPILISLFVIRYSLFVSPTFAQENTSTNTTVTQINPQGNDFENFMKNLLPSFKGIPDTLNQVNCSSLPMDVCSGIKSQSSQPENGAKNSSLNAQVAGDDKKKENEKIVGNAAGQYIVASGIHTPPEVANASTDIISGIITAVSKFFGDLFKKGESQAKNYAGTVLPEKMTQDSFTQGKSIDNSIASENSNILGAQSGEYAMDRALPLVQCADLPAGLCGDDNKPNFANK